MNALDQLRSLARGKVHGGYRWMAIMADKAPAPYRLFMGEIYAVECIL
jgi:hypothetical protein